MGEIGIPPLRFKRKLKWWEIKSIVRGYNRRSCNLWSAVRWHAFHIMCVMPYNDMQGKGLLKPADLMPLPCDKSDANIPSQDDINETQRIADALNKERGFG